MCQSHSFFLWNHFWVTFIDIWWFFLVTLIVIQTYSGLFVLPCVDASISFWLSLFLSVWPDGWMGYSFFIWSITTIKICPEIVKESSKFPPPHTHILNMAQMAKGFAKMANGHTAHYARYMIVVPMSVRCSDFLSISVSMCLFLFYTPPPSVCLSSSCLSTRVGGMYPLSLFLSLHLPLLLQLCFH